MLNQSLNEPELTDDYPVHYDYLYVCDGEVVRSEVRGTVLDLKINLRQHRGLETKIILRCDIDGRRMQADAMAIENMKVSLEELKNKFNENC